MDELRKLWINANTPYAEWYKCGNCSHLTTGAYSYCPKCGIHKVGVCELATGKQERRNTHE